MPFSSLSDPADLARAQRALDATWERIQPLVDEADQQKERARLAYIVAAFTLVAFDEEDLAERAWNRFWEKKRTGCGAASQI